MSNPNPYAAPEETIAIPAKPLPGAGTLFASLATVAFATIGGGLIGMGAGFIGGTLAPTFYVPDYKTEIAVNLAMAIGLGQGLAGGCPTGLVLVALFYWYRSRVRRREEPESHASAGQAT